MKKFNNLKTKMKRLLIKAGAFLLLKGGEDMVAVYVALISHGVRTLDSVPEPQYEGVKEQLAILGLDGNGKPVKK